MLFFYKESFEANSSDHELTLMEIFSLLHLADYDQKVLIMHIGKYSCNGADNMERKR